MFWAAPGAKPPLASFSGCLPAPACHSSFFPRFPLRLLLLDHILRSTHSSPAFCSRTFALFFPFFPSLAFWIRLSLFQGLHHTLSINQFPTPLNSQYSELLHSRPSPRHLDRKLRPWKHHILLLHIAIFIQSIITLLRQVSTPSSHQYT